MEKMENGKRKKESEKFGKNRSCPKCNSRMKTVKVSIQDADSPVTSYQCDNCGYFDFEKISITNAIEEIKAKESLLSIKQRIIRLSKDRLGMYINRDVARSLNLKGGEEIYVSIPDKNHLLVNINN